MAKAGDNSTITIDQKDLDGVLSRLRNLSKTVSEATGKLRNELKLILEKRQWHNKALAHIRQIADMSETQRADFLRSFDPMYESMMKAHWRDEMADLIPPESE